MPRLSSKRKIRARVGDESLDEFLARTLPPGQTKHAQCFTAALKDARARYDRYVARKKEWWSYTARKARLHNITWHARQLASRLSELDIVSRDDIARRTDPKEIETLLGSLSLLGREMMELVNDTQKNGKPRDLAEERWIVEVADIYEKAFRDPASANRQIFCRLLELSRPSSFPRYGKLNPRQIKRTLERRREADQAIAIR
jgi:hypothetical protein